MSGIDPGRLAEFDQKVAAAEEDLDALVGRFVVETAKVGEDAAMAGFAQALIAMHGGWRADALLMLAVRRLARARQAGGQR